MTSDDRNAPSAPGFRPVGSGSLVTRNCMGCGLWKTAIGSSGSGLRWRCAGCSTQRTKEAA